MLYVQYTTLNKHFMVDAKMSIYFTTDDRLELWGTYGGYD